MISLRPPVTAAPSDRSYWLQSIGAGAITRPLAGHAGWDVAIVGGGYAGLWTALRIRAQAPSMRITILEADFCGSGASGRNGGQVHSWFAEIDMLQRLVGEQEALMLCRATADAIDELGALQASGTIDMDLRLEGWLWTASSQAQEGAWAAAAGLCRALGEERFRALQQADILSRSGSAVSYQGIVEQRAGTVHPAKLAAGLRALDEVTDLLLEVTVEIIVLEQDAVLERLVPALDLALRLGMQWCPADMVHTLLVEPFCQVARDIAGAVVAQQPGPVRDVHAIEA